jgi:hypothetical protein
MIIIEVVRVLLIEMMLMSTHGESDRLQIMGIRQFCKFLHRRKSGLFCTGNQDYKKFQKCGRRKTFCKWILFPLKDAKVDFRAGTSKLGSFRVS